MSNVIIRKFNPEKDSGIIFSTWPKGYYYSGINIGIKPTKREWFSDYYEYVNHKIENPENVSIACMNNDHSTIMGYCVINRTTLEWIYVKEDFRKQGIAKLLLKNKKIELFNNVTKIGKSILEKHNLTPKENQDGNGTANESRQEKQSLQGISHSS